MFLKSWVTPPPPLLDWHLMGRSFYKSIQFKLNNLTNSVQSSTGCFIVWLCRQIDFVWTQITCWRSKYQLRPATFVSAPSFVQLIQINFFILLLQCDHINLCVCVCVWTIEPNFYLSKCKLFTFLIQNLISFWSNSEPGNSLKTFARFEFLVRIKLNLTNKQKTNAFNFSRLALEFI